MLSLPSQALSPEPPLSEADFYRNYFLGETVYITWNVTWAQVSLRLSPAFDWGTVYATLLSVFLPPAFLWLDIPLRVESCVPDRN